MMRLVKSALLALLLALPWASLHAQALSMGAGVYDIPRLEVGMNYNYIHANAPPGKCGCFGLNGGSAVATLNITPVWSGIADITYAHANNVNGTTQNITIINYLFGPRYTRRNHSRFTPYGQILLGGAAEQVNFQFDINRNSFGVLAGGGVTTRIKPKFGLNIIEVDYVYTRIPNGKNNTQNNTRISTGVTYNFGVR
jgi:outer membrane immunogenic protein